MPNVQESDVTILLLERHEEGVQQIDQLGQVIQICCVYEVHGLLRSIMLGVCEVPYIAYVSQRIHPEVSIYKYLEHIEGISFEIYLENQYIDV